MDPYFKEALALSIFALPGVVALGRLVILMLIDPAADFVNAYFGAPRPAVSQPPAFNVNGHARSLDGDHGF